VLLNTEAHGGAQVAETTQLPAGTQRQVAPRSEQPELAVQLCVLLLKTLLKQKQSPSVVFAQTHTCWPVHVTGPTVVVPQA
jgi:hypothetical protein